MGISCISDDLVYNRFDIIYDSFHTFTYKYNADNYQIDAHIADRTVTLNIWGKTFPQEVFDRCVNDVFEKFPHIFYISVTRAGNNYNGWLYRSNNLYIILPESEDSLMARLSKKHRYNLRREKRLLEQEIGKISVQQIMREDITSEMITQYFEWKKITHYCSYDLSPEDYIDKYHVTDAILLYAAQKLIGIVLFCVANSTVYLENFSYDNTYRKYSIGSVQYVIFLKEIIKRKCKICFLGGGRQEYKKYFSSVNSVAYSGKIYSVLYIDRINKWLANQDIYKVAIYGLGAVGIAFLEQSKILNLEISYGIDERCIENKNINVYRIGDLLPDADAVFITIMEKDEEVYKALKDRFSKVYYWNDIENMV